ncbi:sigma-70 family RNA polymerase sigma factor [Clostridium sp. SM-530-WT-3G]|uniref:RNA polymerase sigma factor n=1 Tax=Clostridium sp. SM-530-WT-3G TaxID=2725303 RepID=UPI00145F805B|nr:sigma-70 family RNA polymerase sigma factor [Clostridium sp. SM-530-WT-3G]NME83343.1 sigma-70 family RNA polymerase sigma factor [Clostridium sp. SM-530-WT-3G]
MNDISLRTHEIIEKDLDCYGDMILRLAYSYMKNIHDAEDIVQDVFVQLMKNIDKFESNEHKKSWLITVTRNLCKNKLKSSWFKKRDELVEMPYYDKYKNNDVLDTVMKLPLKYREVIHLFYYEDYSTAQIAEIVGKKESTVRSLLHRGRNILKDILKEEYDFE